MSTIFFDMRGGALKVLITDGQGSPYTKRFGAFSIENAAGAQEIFRQISGESGVKLDSVHLILPSSEVKIKVYKLQKMSPDDARMIVRRKLIAEEGIGDPVFHLMSRDPGGRQQEFVAALVDPEGLKKYTLFFSGFGMKVKTAASSFHANLRAFERAQSGLSQASAIFEIGADSIEIMVIAPSGIIAYEILPVPAVEAEGSAEEQDIERNRKKRLYGIIDALYKFMISYRENSSDTPIEKVLLCGRVDNVEKIADAIEEAIGIKPSLWNPFGNDLIDGAEFVALYGLSLGITDGSAANLVLAALSGKRRLRLSRSAMIILFIIYIAAVMAIFFIVETRHMNSLRLLDAERRENKALALASAGTVKSPDPRESLLRLAEKQPVLYDIFRYLGNNLPQEVSLEELLLKQEGGEQVLQLSFTGKAGAETGGKRYFTTVVDSISSSGRLSLLKEPSFSVSNDSKDPYVHFQVTYRVLPYAKKQ
ncbi:MAG: type IV pilus biogenesis protein PilM [Thermodesulfovibrionales bacterium]